MTSPEEKPAVTAAASRPDLPDRSLTTEEYIKNGMPSPDRVWSGGDMMDAAKCLQKLTTDGYERLPRYDASPSVAVFARMVSPENLSMFSGKRMPVQLRMPLANTYMQGLIGLTKIYAVPYMKYGNLHEEMTAFSAAGLRMAVVTCEVTDEFVASLDKNDPAYSTRVAGRGRMINGLANMVLGNVQFLAELPFPAAGARDRLVGCMIETFPALLPHLPEGTRTDVLRRIEALAKNPPPGVGKKMGELADKVRIAVGRSARGD